MGTHPVSKPEKFKEIQLKDDFMHIDTRRKVSLNKQHLKKAAELNLPWLPQRPLMDNFIVKDALKDSKPDRAYLDTWSTTLASINIGVKSARKASSDTLHIKTTWINTRDDATFVSSAQTKCLQLKSRTMTIDVKYMEYKKLKSGELQHCSDRL